MNKPLRMFEGFAGYGSTRLAMNRLKERHDDFEYDVVGISEISKNALAAYKLLHGDCPNYGDISKIDWKGVPDFDLLTYSFPCQSISQAGLRHGFIEGSGTRSSLLWECRKAIAEKKPKYLLMENVKAIINQKNLPNLEKWIDELSGLGYRSWYKCINAVDHGIAQLRERVYMVSIRDDGDDPVFDFPVPKRRYLAVKDVMENDVPSEYYIDLEGKYGFRRCRNETDVLELIKEDCKWRRDGCGDANLEDDFSIRPRYKKKNGNCWNSISERVLCYESNPSFTITTSHIPLVYGPGLDWKIRSCTERELFRIMDMDDSDIDKILNGVDDKGKRIISKNQCAILAGNSICVGVLTDIYEQMFYYKPVFKPLF